MTDSPAHFLDDDGQTPERDEARLPEDKTRSEKERLIRCRACSLGIARASAVFVAPGCDGPKRVFANPSGRVFEVLTVRQADGLRLAGESTPEFTWFAGYAWRAALCQKCVNHVGWAFSAARTMVSPDSFFALITSEIHED